MKHHHLPGFCALGLLSLTLSGCISNPDKPVPSALAKLEAVGGSPVRGLVTLGEHQGMMRIFVDVTGLPGEHGFHIHEEADCRTAIANISKGHFNPDGKPHGEHAGDLGNIRADIYGTMRAPIFNKTLTVTGKYGVIGHTLIITSHPDDYRSQPDGRSGVAIACGQILPI